MLSSYLVFSDTGGSFAAISRETGGTALIGSTNFDPRSFRINDEISVAIFDAQVAGELVRAFEDHARFCEKWTLDRWKRRSLAHRLRNRVSVLARRQL